MAEGFLGIVLSGPDLQGFVGCGRILDQSGQQSSMNMVGQGRGIGQSGIRQDQRKVRRTLTSGAAPMLISISQEVGDPSQRALPCGITFRQIFELLN